MPPSLALLKTGLLLRQCKRRKEEFDVLITANNEADFGRRGIQYVHYPWMARPRPPQDLRWYHGSRFFVQAYYAFCRRLSDYSLAGMKRNVTLVNSDWVGARVREILGIEAEVLHPPAAGTFPDVPWEERRNGFVCIGRISPEKRLDRLIEVIAAVRARQHEVHLHIIGSADDDSYSDRIRQLVQQNRDWAFLHEDVSRPELVRIVSTHRYGIHGMVDEHFGMAVAEMVRGGCVVFVPNSGGAVEIVGDEPRLRYDDPDDAVEKICAVLDNADRQKELRKSLVSQGEQFSAEHFVQRIREVVRQL